MWLCKKHNLRLILDAAHMAGTYTKEVYGGCGFTTSHCGWEADATVFSFQAVKNLPTADSGMICFKEEKYDKLVRQLAWLGIDKDTYSRSDDKGSYKWKYDVPNIGFKYHGNSIMASIGLTQLKYLDEDNDKRNEIASTYDKLLKDEPVQTIMNSWHTEKSSRHLYQIRVDADKRDDVVDSLCRRDIYPGVHYISNLNYPMYSYAKGTCPKAESYSNELVTLPIHLGITIVDCIKAVQTIRGALQ
jgi:dTDP-4-amino-4,6-dideoxygalactose transaminase